MSLEQTSIAAVWTWLIHLPILGVALLALFAVAIALLVGLVLLAVKLLL